MLCINSRRYTGFVGFIIGMISAEQMYKDYVVTGELPHLALFYLSQDVLESFFGRVSLNKLLQILKTHYKVYKNQ